MAVSVYQESPPRGALGRHLVCRWTQEIAPGVERYAQRVVPDGCIDLLWLEARLVIAGPDTGPVVALIPPGSVAGVRFRPGQAPGVLGVPASELLDQRVALADVWGEARAGLLAERLHAAPTADAASLLLEQAVVGRLRASGPRSDLLVEGLVAAARAAAAPLDVAGFAEYAGVSERQLRRRSVHAFGYPPRTLDRAIRKLCRLMGT